MGASLPLADRKLLITAGPTWVRLDAVRHLSNASSGATGLAIAREAAARGARVTLLMGPGRALPTEGDRARMRVLEFVTFDDLHSAVREHVGARGYDALIHLAAVSDYRPVEEAAGKLPSDAEELVLRLRRTPKIIDEVRRLHPEIVLVKFKLEVGEDEESLLQIARESRARSDADLIVANDLLLMRGELHPALIVDREGRVERVETTQELAARLLDAVGDLVRERAPRTAAYP